MTERIIYEVTVTDEERSWTEDIPEEYRVLESDECDSRCIVYGKYSAFRKEPEWIANPSCRWLVRHLIEQMNSLRADRDERAKQKGELLDEIERLRRSEESLTIRLNAAIQERRQ